MTHSTRNSMDQPDREIVITRVFDAPREMVFEAWTDPKHMPHWYGPQGFSVTLHEMDVRPGGICRFIMHGPDGIDYPNRMYFREVVKPERLSYDYGSGEGDPEEFQVTVTFDQQGDKTKLTMRSVFPTAEQRDRVVKECHAIEGGNQTLDRLAQYLTTMA